MTNEINALATNTATEIETLMTNFAWGAGLLLAAVVAWVIVKPTIDTLIARM